MSGIGKKLRKRTFRDPEPARQRALARATKLTEERYGNTTKAKKILLPLLKRNDPEAMFLYAVFSTREESPDDFEKRRMSLLRKLADMDYAPALYELAVCYEYGDFGAEKNPVIAAALYEKSASLDYAKARLDHGLNMFYGSNGVEKNVEKGLASIRQAAQENVGAARDILKDLSEKPA